MKDKNANSNEPILLEHDADGIQELDNLLPRWWLWMFYLTVVFSVAYVGYYHVFRAGDLQAAEYDKEAKAGEQIKAAAMANFESSLVSLEPSKDTTVVAQGHQIFTKNCAPCHREDGGGLVGPNLCDDYWIHGGQFTDTVKTILNGVPEKGMLTWKGILKPNEIVAVASYIYQFRGTTPPNPKPPENQQQAPTGPSVYE